MLVYFKLLLTMIFWGGTFIAARVVAQHVGAFSAAFLRFVTASVFLILLVRYQEGKFFKKVRKEHVVRIILLGMTGIFLYNVFFFKGLKVVEAGRSAVIIAMNPIFIALFSSLIFKEKLNLIQIIGVLISVSGALFVIVKGDLNEIFRGGFGLGELFIFGCVVCWVLYTLIGKVVIADLSPLVSVTYATVVGTAVLLFPAFFEGVFSFIPDFSIYDWISILYLGIFGTVIGFVWYYQGIQKIGPTKAGLFINFVPISAIILAFLLLDEPITFSLFIGTLLVVSGVYLTNAKKILGKVKVVR